MVDESAIARARSTLEELRKLLPDQAARIDALARQLTSGNRDELALTCSAKVTLLPQNERTPACR